MDKSKATKDWLVIGDEKWFKLFARFHQQLESNSIKHEQVSLEDFLAQPLDNYAKSKELILVAPTLRGMNKLSLTRISQSYLESTEFDYLIKLNGCFWPKSSFSAASHSFFSDRVQHLSSDHWALIAGADVHPNSLLQCLTQLGFKQVYFVVADIHIAEPIIQDLRKRYYGVKIEGLVYNDLPTMAAKCSIVINTISDADDPVLNNLYYFNFLRGGGVVFDYTFSEKESELNSLAKDVGARVFSGFDFYEYQLDVIINL